MVVEEKDTLDYSYMLDCLDIDRFVEVSNMEILDGQEVTLKTEVEEGSFVLKAVMDSGWEMEIKRVEICE